MAAQISLVHERIVEKQMRPPVSELPLSSPETPGLEELKKLMQRSWSHEPSDRPPFFPGELVVSLAARGGLGLRAGAIPKKRLSAHLQPNRLSLRMPGNN